MKTPRRVPDDLWEEVERLLPPTPPPEHGGRPRTSERLILDAILYVFWAGCAWRALPKEFGPWQTVYDRFAEWKRAGVYEQIHAKCLHLYDERQGIEWEWQAGDGTYVRSPEGGKECGPNPTDRAKPGVKDHVLVDGRGVPLSILVTAANVNDSPVLDQLINHCAVVRPRPSTKERQHLCLDAAYDNATAQRVVLLECYEGHIAPRGGRDESLPRHESGQARRWVVERTHAWHDRFRRLVVNWEKTLTSRTAFLWLASALVAYRT